MNLPARMIIVILFLIFQFCLLNLLGTFRIASAQTYGSPNNNSSLKPDTNPDVPDNLHTYTQSVFIELSATAICYLAGIDILREDGKCLGLDPKTKKIGFVEGGGGLLGLTGNMIAGTFNIPVSSGQYIAYASSQFGIAKPSYAQGIGFQGLQPLLKYWQALRDIVYLLFVVAFIIIGLGIMFRIQIDPRTVMTIQNQIPKIVIILVLVTFSYALAGLLVDFMWVISYLIITILARVDPNLINVAQVTTDLGGRNPLEFVNNNVSLGTGGIMSIVGNSAGAVSSIIASIFQTQGPGSLAGGVIGGIIGAVVGGIPCFAIGGPFGMFACGAAGLLGGGFIGANAEGVIGGIGAVVASIIILIAILYSLFRLWFVLIKAYVYVLLGVVFAPIWIMFGIIPTTQAGFGNWLRHMVAYLSVFPSTIVMLLSAKIFMANFGNLSSTNQFVPPLIGNPNLLNSMAALLGLGIILLTPEVVNIVKEALKAPEFKYVAAIGKGLGAGTGVLGGTATTTGSIATSGFIDPITGKKVGFNIGRVLLRLVR